MTVILWLLRHAHALDNPPPGGRDRDRALSRRGEREATDLGRQIAAREIPGDVPDLVICSPAVRTRSTAELAFTKVASPISRDKRLYQATPDDVLDIVREIPDEIRVMAVVGHNPTIHGLALDLATDAGADHPASAFYPPATLCVLEFPAEGFSSLEWGTGELIQHRVPEAI